MKTIFGASPCGLGSETRLLPVDVPSRLTPYAMLMWFAIALYSYRHVFRELMQQWQSDANYSHGPVVIPIAIWLLWHRRGTMPKAGKPWASGGLGLLLVAYGLLWVGQYYHLPGLQRWTIPLWICGMIGSLMGRRWLVWSLPAVVFLGFMIPIPFRIETSINEFLQWTSATCSCYLLGLTSTFAVTDGYSLTLASGELGITRDCSGLRMSVAIAAIAFIVPFLNNGYAKKNGSPGAQRWKLTIQLSGMLLLVLPAAIFANAVRIATVALVIEHFQNDAYTSMVHDLGDWCVLPLSGILFLAFRQWLLTVAVLGNARSRHASAAAAASRPRRLLDASNLGWVRSSAGPLALALGVAAMIVHYEILREHEVRHATLAAKKYEAQEEWRHAEACYQSLRRLQLPTADTLYHLAWVKLQGAESQKDHMQAFLLLESALQRSPFHVPALQSHLRFSLDHDFGNAASESAERLYAVHRHNAESIQLCVEAMLRYPRESPGWPAFDLETLNSMVDRFGPTTQWRDRLVMALASHCCEPSARENNRLRKLIEPLVEDAANQLASAEAHLVAWQYEQLDGTRQHSIERARNRIDAECPSRVAYKIYRISAKEAQRDGRVEDARQFIENAIELMPEGYPAYALLGDFLRSQEAWAQSTAAYLRAWRLAGDRPPELGVKLAEALVRSRLWVEAERLSIQLLSSDDEHLNNLKPGQRIRLFVVQSQVDIQATRYQQALQRLRRCQLLARQNDPASAELRDRAQTIESLEAQCLVRLGRYSQAARLFEHRAIRSDHSIDAWTAAARAWRSAGNSFAAECCYRNAVKQLGCDDGVWLEYIRLLSEDRQRQRATQEIALRVLRSGSEPVSDKTLAQAWEIVGDLQRAIQHYRLAADVEAEAVAALAIALARVGNVDDAIALVDDATWAVSTPVRAHTAAVIGTSADRLTEIASSRLEHLVQQGISDASNDTGLLMAAVEWYSRRQQHDTAIDLLEQTLRAQPENILASNNLAMLLADEGRDCVRALQLIESVLKQTGPLPVFLDTKGWILVQMDRAEEAIPWLLESIEGSHAPDAAAHLHIATAYLVIGERTQARQFLESAQRKRLNVEQLNDSERRAWDCLLREFTPHEELSRKPSLKQEGEAR